MDAERFRAHGAEMLDYITSYLKNIEQRAPLHNVTPGYLQKLIPDEPPNTPDAWCDVMRDIERVIMPGITHWHSPHFHAYYPTGNSYPAILADMLSDAIGCVGFTWQSASDSTVLAILSARAEVIRRLQSLDPSFTHGQAIDRLVAYTSEIRNSCVERAGLMALTKTRCLPTDGNGSLRGSTLEAAIEEDRAKGLIPFFCCATIGTTATCSFDSLEELGPVCTDNAIWLHVDAAYAGAACICPEYRYLINGVEHCTTFNFNPHKWMNVNFDCSALWVRKRSLISEAFVLDSLIMKHPHQNNGNTMPDFMNWEIPLGRRFRSLKLWFVIRSFGVEGLQANIRKDVWLAKLFESLVRKDNRFEIVAQVVLGLVCFRLKDSNETNEKLHDMINADGRIHLVPSSIHGKYILRFVVCARSTQASHIQYAWNAIREMADKLMMKRNNNNQTIKHVTTVVVRRL